MPTTYTAYLRLPKPDFNTSPWHMQMHQSIDAIDSAIYNALILQSMSTWANETAFAIGARVVDSTDGTLWLCAVAHTSASSPTTFAADRLANPTYWSVIAPGIQTRGAWANSTTYKINDLTYDQALGIVAICNVAHTSSGSPATIDTDAAYWTYIIDSNSTVNSANLVSYDSTASGLGETNVQDAIDEVVAQTNTALALRAPKADPTFTGTVTVPTQSSSDNTTKAASTAFVQSVAAVLRGGVDAAYDTLAEIAAALALLAPLASPVFTGNPTAPTPAPGDSDTTLATTAFVSNAIASAAGTFPSGTRIVFQQTTAPTGWTKDGTVNDMALRVVSGSVGSGGSVNFSTLFARTTTDNIVLSGGYLPTITNGTIDNVPGYDGTAISAGNNIPSIGGSVSGMGYSGSGAPFAADIDMRVKYLDTIVASKN